MVIYFGFILFILDISAYSWVIRSFNLGSTTSVPYIGFLGSLGAESGPISPRTQVMWEPMFFQH